MEKLKKQSSTNKTRLNFQFLLCKTLGAIKPVQVNCMMITCGPTQLFQASFQSHCRHKNFNSCYKKEHLKGNRDCERLFCAHFTMGQDSPVTSLIQRHYLKNIFEGVWDSDFKWSEKVKFATFLCLKPRGSLNSSNQWINYWPLYQNLFQPLDIWQCPIKWRLCVIFF